MNYLVSICIPAYRQPLYLEECLNYVRKQTYKQVEVLITDDTPDESVKIVAERFTDQLNIFYKKNEKPLGSPTNWNEVLKMATGEFVILMHHDDRFLGEDSLQKFITPFIKDATVDFVFGRNTTIEKMKKGSFNSFFFNKYYKNPQILIAGQTLGPPSNLMIKKSALEFYDTRYKWIVDIEYYFRLFRAKYKFYYVDEYLIEVGIHSEQITNEVITDSQVLIFENVSFAVDYLQKINNIKVFDFYWRLIRNNNIRSIDDVVATGIIEDRIPFFIKKIISVQRNVSTSSLHKGFISKLLMLFTYLRS